jgi:hypothetical protein
MTKSGILLILTVVVASSLALSAFVACSNCSVDPTDQDWASSAASFMEGKPINDVPSSLSNVQQYRLRNTDFNSSLLTSSPSQASNVVSNPVASNTAASNAAVPPTHTTTTPMLNIVLNNTSAAPNPANFSDPVKITAVFGNNSSSSEINATSNNLSTSADLTNLMVYASIKNSAGTDISRVNMRQTSGNEYAGIWNANVASGTYKVTIDASGPGGSKTFNDALQIVVNGSKSSPNTTHAVRNLG